MLFLNNLFDNIFRSDEHALHFDILDVGCGRGGAAPFLKLFSNRLLGVDIHRPWLKVSEERNCYDELIQCDLNYWLPFQDKSFDISICFETLEHLEKPASVRLLDEVERVTKRLVAVTTPSYFNPADNPTRIERNPYQAHHSAWSLWDFWKRGYKVRGCGFRWGSSPPLNVLAWYLPFLAKRFFAWKMAE